VSAATRPSRASAVAGLLDDLGRATDDLRRAAGEDDPRGIHDAVDRRQTLVDRLETLVGEIRDGSDGAARAELEREMQRLAEQAAEAERDLRHTVERALRERALRSEQASAVRGYAAAPVESRALDRAG
jgi:hypothetical protein